MKFGQTLVTRGRLTQKQLEFAVDEKDKRGLGKSLGSLLVELGYLKLIPEEMVHKYKVFPVFGRHRPGDEEGPT